MAALREIFARFGIDVDSSKLDRLNKKTKTATSRLKRADVAVVKITKSFAAMGIGLGAGLLVRGLGRFVEQVTSAADELAKTSQQIGLSTAQMQQWRFAAELGGVAASDMSRAFQQTQRRAVEATDGSAEAQQSFQDMGVAWTDAAGNVRDVDAIMLDVADSMSANENATERVGLAMRLMGRNGAQLLPMLMQGSAGVQAMREEFERLGGGASPEMIRQSEEWRDALTRIKVSTLSLTSTFMTRLLPVLLRGAEHTGRFAVALADVFEHSNLLKASLIVLSGVAAGVAVAFAPMALPVVAVVGAVALLILVLDDLYTTAEGGESVTSNLLTQLVGLERATAIIEGLDQAIQGLRETLATVGGFFGLTVGEEGTDLRRASELGGEGLRGFNEAIASPFVAFDEMQRTLRGGAAPALTGESEALLPQALGAAATRRSTRALGARRGTAHFEETYPELVELEQAPRVVGSQPMSLPLYESPAGRPVAGGGVTIDAHGDTTVNISEATDVEEVDRRVRRGIREENDRAYREIADLVEQSAT